MNNEVLITMLMVLCIVSISAFAWAFNALLTECHKGRELVNKFCREREILHNQIEEINYKYRRDKKKILSECQRRVLRLKRYYQKIK